MDFHMTSDQNIQSPQSNPDPLSQDYEHSNFGHSATHAIPLDYSQIGHYDQSGCGNTNGIFAAMAACR